MANGLWQQYQQLFPSVSATDEEENNFFVRSNNSQRLLNRRGRDGTRHKGDYVYHKANLPQNADSRKSKLGQLASDMDLHFIEDEEEERQHDEQDHQEGAPDFSSIVLSLIR